MELSLTKPDGAPLSFGMAPVTGMIVRTTAFGPFWTTINQVFDGHVVVFMEIFAIVDFFTRHLRAFGVPAPNERAAFRECLSNFVRWWDVVQPSNRRVPEMADIRVDRNDMIIDGLMQCLEGDALAGSLLILQNEQQFTLQEYMYDLVDRGNSDEMELGLLLKGYRVASRFAYDLSRTDVT